MYNTIPQEILPVKQFLGPNQPQVTMTLKPELIRPKNKQMQIPTLRSSYTPSQLTTEQIPRSQVSDELIDRQNKSEQIYSSTYQRCRQITSKARDCRNRFTLALPINIEQNIFKETLIAGISRSQNMNQISVGSFTVTEQYRLLHLNFESTPTQLPSK